MVPAVAGVDRGSAVGPVRSPAPSWHRPRPPPAVEPEAPASPAAHRTPHLHVGNRRVPTPGDAIHGGLRRDMDRAILAAHNMPDSTRCLRPAPLSGADRGPRPERVRFVSEEPSTTT